MEEKECWLIRPASAHLVVGHFSTVPHYISTTVYFVKNGIILICVCIYFQMLLLVTRDFRALGSECRLASWTPMTFWPYYRAALVLLFCVFTFFTLHSSNCPSHQHWTSLCLGNSSSLLKPILSSVSPPPGYALCLNYHRLSLYISTYLPINVRIMYTHIYTHIYIFLHIHVYTCVQAGIHVTAIHLYEA